MATTESVRASIDANIKSNGKQEITGMVLNSVLHDVVDLSFNDKGKYPEMTAGFANNLVGRGEAVEATINFRASGGKSIEDGAARVKELRGNSVVMNQQIYGDFRYGSAGWNTDRAGINMSATNGVAELSATTDGDNYVQSLNDPFVLGHKYMFLGESKTTASGVTSFYIFYGNANNATPLDSTSTEWEQKSVFFQCASTTYNFVRLQCPKAGVTHQYRNLLLVDLTQMFGQGNEPTSVEEFYSRIPQNVDLYAYNEGEIISTNAEGIKSVGFNAWDEQWEQGYYDTGRIGTTLLPVASTTRFRSKNPIKVLPNTQYCLMSDMDYMVIIFLDSDGIVLNEQAYGNGATFTTPADCGYLHFFPYAQVANASYTGKICINLSHSGYRNGEYQPYMQFIRDLDPRIREAFPNGMRSAGNAHDKVYNKNGKGYIEKRIGVVDMGSLNWYYSVNDRRFSAPSTIQPRTFQTYMFNMVCANGLVASTAPIAETLVDKTISYYPQDGYFFMYFFEFTDAASLKAALKGVPLFYELATPEVIEYDEPFNLDYEVWDFGTEQMIATKPSAPIKASIVYGFNAVDSIRTAQLEIEAIKTQLAQMQTLMAGLTAQPAMLEE